ncbi:unnamed protein product [Schistosoma mattheei]|uniref:Uncharacterized protein n=1 Tax=Schistosoma mattheei TaxID=31246 RepID=A0A183PV08_9TREM|nr:unnamed protein product [Schistosoma mattheei]
MLKSSYSTCLLISEENDEAIEVEFDKRVSYYYNNCFELNLL